MAVNRIEIPERLIKARQNQPSQHFFLAESYCFLKRKTVAFFVWTPVKTFTFQFSKEAKSIGSIFSFLTKTLLIFR